MTFLRDMKQTLTNGAKDIGKLARLTVEDAKEKIKHEVREEQMEHTLENLQDDYETMKEKVKDIFK